MDPVARFYDAYNAHDPDRLDAVLDGAYVGVENGVRIEGIEQAKRFVAAFLAAFPDCAYTTRRQVKGRDRVAAEWSFTATHQGIFQGIDPTGNRVAASGHVMFEVRGDRIHSLTSTWDAAGLKARLQGNT